MNTNEATIPAVGSDLQNDLKVHEGEIRHPLPASSEAARLHAYGGKEVLKVDEVPLPMIGADQVLVRVSAAGINGLDWKIRDGLLKDVFPLNLPAVLGFELSGVVVKAGKNTSRLKVGDRVIGPFDAIGAYADFVAIDETKLCATPDGLTDIEAAALPVASLTAWQALEAGGLRSGQKVLIQGAAGAVGGFAVQFAKAAGATVLATASTSSGDYVLGLGADEAIDYKTERFEDRAVEIDLVLDLVGGDTLDRSWNVLAPDGVIVSTTQPDLAARVPAGRRGLGIMMDSDAERLRKIADDVAAGTLKSRIAEVVEFSELSDAIERNKTGHAPGKTVVNFVR
jgi:NADPH:quinone reductase-like Zn-dependent oxidoreductase